MQSSDASLGTIHCVVIICEEAIEAHIGRDIVACGAKGYTVSEVRGRGNRGVRDAQWILSSNIRIEVLCNADVACRVLQMAETKYSQHYGLVAYMLSVTGPRADKY